MREAHRRKKASRPIRVTPPQPGGEDDDYSKRTCLWTGGGFRLPQQRPIPEFRPLYIHNLPPSAERGDLRSITPPGFARAVFEANLGRGAHRA